MAKQNEAVAHSSLVDGTEISLHSHGGGAAIPTGVIAMWSGLKANIPVAWYLCDGTNGTPDLRSKFICSIGAADEPGGTGGSETLTHAGSAVGDHTNVAVPGTVTGAVKIGTSASNAAAQTHTHTIASITHSVTQPNNHTGVKPPYYTLAFIMKGAS